MNDKVSKYVKGIVTIANFDIHGYSMEARWGNPDYDCSSLVISVIEESGIPVRSNGATYTGNMYDAFIKSGFKDVTAKVNKETGDGLQVGDVLLNHVHHTEIYTSPGTVTGAHWDYDGKEGDSSGLEICSKPYYNYPWDCVLRYGEDEPVKNYSYSLEEVQLALQCINGDFGTGDERKKAIKEKGFKYAKIQNLINNIIAFVW